MRCLRLALAQDGHGARSTLLLAGSFASLLLTAACNRKPEHVGFGQAISIGPYQMSVSSVEASYRKDKRLLVVFVHWRGVDSSSPEQDRIDFVGACLAQRFTIVDGKGNKFRSKDPMPEEQYRIQQTSNLLPPGGKRPSQNQYSIMTAQRERTGWLQDPPVNWAVVFEIPQEAQGFTLWVGRSRLGLLSPFTSTPPDAAIRLDY